MKNFTHLVILFKKIEQKDCDHFEHRAVLFSAKVPLTDLA